MKRRVISPFYLFTSDELERELQRLREEQLRKMLELQNEIALLKQRALWERRPEPLPAPPPQPVCLMFKNQRIKNYFVFSYIYFDIKFKFGLQLV